MGHNLGHSRNRRLSPRVVTAWGTAAAN